FRASTESGDRDIVYFQGHAAPGIYARAYLEGRIPKQKLENFRRELKPGDGEMDEPEALGSITLASRERLDNLIFVVNCNLQRLDGPVRGNGKIIQELEAIFRG